MAFLWFLAGVVVGMWLQYERYGEPFRSQEEDEMRRHVCEKEKL